MCWLSAGEGEHVADSPYPVLLVPGPPHPRRCLVTGSGRSVAVAGSAAAFEVVLQDEYGNRCSVARSAELARNAQEDRTGAADKTTAQGQGNCFCWRQAYEATVFGN